MYPTNALALLGCIGFATQAQAAAVPPSKPATVACQAKWATQLKAAVPSYPSFCNLWLSLNPTSTTLSPIAGLTISQLYSECGCLGAKPSTLKARPSKLTIPSVKSCPAANVAALKTGFVDAAAFCKYYQSQSTLISG